MSKIARKLAEQQPTKPGESAVELVPLWDLEYTAKILGVSEATARRLFYSGKLKGLRLHDGPKAPIRFRPHDVATFIAGRMR